jgi:succinate dehydrogenase/fumarate reductase iron-sulfur protein
MTGSKEIRVRLFRYDPSADENPRYEIFSVPKRPDMRVLDALNHIYNLEETGAVAYRWYCGTKKCGECGITVNGRAMLGCWEPTTEEMTIEPLANFPIIRDLVVDTEPYEKLLIKLRPVLHRSDPPRFPEALPHSIMLGAQRLLKCIECNVCTASVPVKGVGPAGVDWDGYTGPAALVRFARFVLDPRDQLDRTPLARDAGLRDFPLFETLRTICPQAIDIVSHALVPAKQRLFGSPSGVPHAVSSTAPFIMAKSWSAFVRLTNESKKELEDRGAIKPLVLPEFGEAYRLSEP